MTAGVSYLPNGELQSRIRGFFSPFSRGRIIRKTHSVYGVSGIFSSGMAALDRRAKGGFFVLGIMLSLDVHYPPYSSFFIKQ